MSIDLDNPLADKIYLGVKKESQLGKLLIQLAKNPLTKTETVCSSLTQKTRKGNSVPITPTRGTFLLDILADATEGRESAHRPRKGLVMVAGIRNSLRTDEPKHSAVEVVENVQKISVDKIELDGEIKAQPVIPSVTVAGGTTDALSATSALDAKPPKMNPDAPAAGTDSGEVPIVFPETPRVPTKLAGYVKPAWYNNLDLALKAKRHVAIFGPPGIGKSTAAEYWAAENNQPMVVINGDGGLRRHHIEGTIEMTNGSTRFVCAEYAASAINGWVCVINEVNAADPDALLYLNGQMEVPFRVNVHGRSYPVHPNFRLIVTYNPGLVGTKPLPQAFKDRFFPIKVDFPDDLTLEKILWSKGMPKVNPYRNELFRFAKSCFDLHKKNQLRYQLSPRRLFDTVFLIETAKMPLKQAIQAAIIDFVENPAEVQALQSILNGSGQSNY